MEPTRTPSKANTTSPTKLTTPKHTPPHQVSQDGQKLQDHTESSQNNLTIMDGQNDQINDSPAAGDEAPPPPTAAAGDSVSSAGIGSSQDILDQMEGFSDFSKLVEVVRTKYVPEESFVQLKSNMDKIQFILDQQVILESFDAYTKSIATSTSESSTKSLEKANELRIKGNKFFKIKKYTESLKLFSRAILYAPYESPELPQLFANRSATLFHLNQFADCLLDTQFALEHPKYPPGQRYTLLLRKSLCLKALNKLPDAQATLKQALEGQPINIQQSINSTYEQFTYTLNDDTTTKQQQQQQSTTTTATINAIDSPANCPVVKSNSKLVNASDWVKLAYSSEKGHHLKATRNVNRDQVVINEKPYASILNSQFFDTFCQNCCVELKNHTYPCPGCCTVSYCSQECQVDSWNSYHQFECKFLSTILSMGVLRLSLRILLVTGLTEALAVHNELAGDTGNNSSTGSNVIRLDKDKIKRENNYRAIYTLCDHSNSLNYLVSSRQAIASAFMLHLLSPNYISLVDPQVDQVIYWTIGSLLLKHTHQISVNSIVLFHQPILPGPHGINGIDIKSQSIGTAIYPSVSLINHSCIPNTEFYYNGSTICVKTKCSIVAGDEITCTYGPLFKKMSRAERMETLSSQYYFKCSCPACNDEQVYTKNNTNGNNNYNCIVDSPILAECFLCPSCFGPMVINGPTEGKCLACKTITVDLKNILEKIDSVKKLINVSKALLQFGRPSESEKNLLKAQAFLTKISWPPNRYMLTLYTELITIYTSPNGFDGSGYEQSKKYIEVSNKIKASIYGVNSFEYLHGQLQLLNLRWTLLTSNVARNTNTPQPSASMNKKLLARLITESNSLIQVVHEALDASKISGDLLVLDSSLVQCLKELVQLEKQIKQQTKQ